MATDRSPEIAEWMRAPMYPPGICPRRATCCLRLFSYVQRGDCRRVREADVKPEYAMSLKHVSAPDGPRTADGGTPVSGPEMEKRSKSVQPGVLADERCSPQTPDGSADFGGKGEADLDGGGYRRRHGTKPGKQRVVGAIYGGLSTAHTLPCDPTARR